MDMIGAGFRAFSHRDQIEQLKDLIMPVVEHAQRVYPQALPLARLLVAEIFPETQTSVADNGLITIRPEWVQENFNKYRGEKLKVDGVYGEGTKTAVKKFQVEKGLTVDGWFGEKSLIAFCKDLP